MEAPPPVIDTQAPPASAEQVRLTLRDVTLEGVTAVDAALLKALASDLIGKDIALSDVYALADRMTAAYRNAGYVLSQMTVPPQKITDGTVVLRAVEGYIDKVSVEGDAGRGDLFQTMGLALRQSRPLRNDVLERYSLLANDLPGVKARLLLKPSPTTPGAADAVFVIEQDVLEAQASFDNRGTETSGPREYTLGLTANSLLGLYEQTQVTWINTTEAEELRYLSALYRQTLNAEGTMIELRANRSRGEPGEYLQSLEQRSRNVTFTASLSHPLIRTRGENLSVSVAMTTRDSRSHLLGDQSYADHTRSLTLGTAYDVSDAWQGVTYVGLDVTQGVEALGASRNASTTKSRSRGRSDFTKVTLDLSRRQALAGPVSLVAALTAQYAATALLSSEEFGYGGSRFGRAYDWSEITGDNGAAASLELQYTATDSDLGLRLFQPYAFYDFGVTHDRDPINQEGVRTGASTGAGVRFALTEILSGDVQVALPLTRPVSSGLSVGEGMDPRLFFHVSTRF